jgi:hypothetical protein
MGTADIKWRELYMLTSMANFCIQHGSHFKIAIVMPRAGPTSSHSLFCPSVRLKLKSSSFHGDSLNKIPKLTTLYCLPLFPPYLNMAGINCVRYTATDPVKTRESLIKRKGFNHKVLSLARSATSLT